MPISPEYVSAYKSYIDTPVRMSTIVVSTINPSGGFLVQIATPPDGIVPSTPVPVPAVQVTQVVMTVTAGIAIADSVVVHWQDHDLQCFRMPMPALWYAK
jgi:malonyl CoA-acyl carrier protein transacylase